MMTETSEKILVQILEGTEGGRVEGKILLIEGYGKVWLWCC